MTEFFLHIVNMSISASWIVLAVMLLRFLLKKAPKWITVALWGIVAVRLICPFSVESAFSLIPSSQTIHPEAALNPPAIHSGVPMIDHVMNPIISQATISLQPEKDLNFFQFIMPYLAGLWLVGMIALCIYTAASFVRIKRKIGTAVLLRDNIFQNENVIFPFVLGMIKPKIYLPFHISAQDMEHVIAHEQAHIRRGDHFWKPLGFVILTLHWLNPLIWLGFVLFCRDMELACDEKVVKDWSADKRADYSQALLTCSVNRRRLTACPLAFGEAGVKGRIKSVLNYKKPAVWVVSAAVILSVATALCFLTNPKARQTEISEGLQVFLDGQIAERHHSAQTGDNFAAVDYRILDVADSSDEITVYMWVLYHEYSLKNGDIYLEAGAHVPTAVTVKRTDSAEHFEEHYELIEYWTPRDGTYYADDIEAKFPRHLISDALDSQKYIDEQQASCERKALEYYGIAVSDVGGADAPKSVMRDQDNPE